MREELLRFALPLIGEAEIDEVVDTLRSNWITTGPKTQAFATDFAGYVGAPAALGVSSCTAALHLALLAGRVGPGDAVFTSTMTFCSTVHVIEHVGATPVLVDVEPDTLNLDPECLADAVRQAPGRPAAVIPVHFAGHPCDMDAVLDLARAHDLLVVEDAAHALPARHGGQMVGHLGDGSVRRAVAFSFYATKNLTTAEGGMLTGTPEFVDDARVWSLHGMSRDAWKRYGAGGSWFYEVVEAGFKYNMTDIQAAMGIHQLRQLDRFDARRREIVERYAAGLADVDAVELPAERTDVRSAWHLFVIRLHLDRLAIDRNAFIEELDRRLIQTSVHFIPVHLHPYYRERYGYAPDAHPVALREFHRSISLPLHLQLTDDDVDDVVEAVRDVAAAHRR